MAEDFPRIDFGERDQFGRFAQHLVVLHRRAMADKQLGKKAGHVYRVEVTRVKRQRSEKQNAFYWAVMMPMAAKGFRDAWEESTNSYDAHEFFKDRFLRVPVVNKRDGSGEVMGWRTRSTTELTTLEFVQYLEEIYRFCMEYLQLELPVPDPNWRENMLLEDRVPQLPPAQRSLTDGR